MGRAMVSRTAIRIAATVVIPIADTLRGGEALRIVDIQVIVVILDRATAVTPTAIVAGIRDIPIPAIVATRLTGRSRACNTALTFSTARNMSIARQSDTGRLCIMATAHPCATPPIEARAITMGMFRATA